MSRSISNYPDRQGGESLYIPNGKATRGSYMLKHTQVIREVKSVTMIPFNRTGKRENKKVLMPILIEKSITLVDKIKNKVKFSVKKKEKTDPFLSRASNLRPDGYWMRINYKEKQIPHFDF